jgi:hypothetical protein
MGDYRNEVKYFTYFLFFPEQNLLYFGRGTPSRYRHCTLGSLFHGPHHNSDVEDALKIEPAIWVLHRKYDSPEESERGEGNYLSLYWGTGEWVDRPKWMLNRSNSSKGGSFPAQMEGVYKSMEKGTHNFFSEEGRKRNSDRMSERNRNNNAEHNRTDRMKKVTLLNNSIRCCCLECRKECSRPGMGMHLKRHDKQGVKPIS